MADLSEGDRSWKDRVASALDEIGAGNLTKVVLSRKRTIESEKVDYSAVLGRLRRERPNCYTFLVRPESDVFFGSTPERLVALRYQSFSTPALAGTIRRGDSHDEDHALARLLGTSTKNRSEHRAVIRSIERAMQPMAERLNIAPRPEVVAYPEAFHLRSEISGTLRQPSNALSLAMNLHPTAAICASPSAAAKALLGQDEPQRGWYGGAIGWIDGDGDGTFGVALRSALMHRGRLTMWAGAGVVAGSVPEDELAETELKFAAMQRALQKTSSPHSDLSG